MCARVRVVLFCVGLALLAPRVASAQTSAPDHLIRAGVKGGIVMSNLTGDGVSGPKRKTGLAGGLFVGYDINEMIGVQVEGLVSERGAKFDDERGTGEFSARYFDIPLLVKVGRDNSIYNTHFFVFAGPTFGLRMKAELTANGQKDPNFTEADIEGVDTGLTFGIGAQGSRFLADIRYTRGTKNVEKSGANVKHSSLTLMAGIRLW